ncbi:MAG: hypothetical protein K0U66_10490 [Gammaproteobacteria bacterium]|nr:hypothetical protein [Gammaproteobacteria bacterium]
MLPLARHACHWLTGLSVAIATISSKATCLITGTPVLVRKITPYYLALFVLVYKSTGF